MVRIKSSSEVILSLIDFFRIAQPLLDTKSGSVSRDIIIDGPATQFSRLYEELGAIANKQSFRNSIGLDLDLLAQNFGAVRQRGAKSTGPTLLTFTSLEADIPINAGDIITAKNGATFTVINSFNVSPVFANTFRAVASRFRTDVDFVGITDEFAVEVLAEASSSGASGNISKYSINRTTIPNISNVTNVFPFGGGRDTEDDATFRNRVLSIFSGANTGTALGYRNAALSDTSVIDAIVIEPGDELMTRDGTQVYVAEDGTKTITSEGTGGKIDVYIFGTRIQEVVNSYIYKDLSNTGEATNIANDFVFGQIEGDENKTVSRKRLDNIKANVLPNQPVNSIIQISGSLSGANFLEKTTDSLGRVSGNYEIIKDTGAFAGSPWGFDRLHWIKTRIEDLEENQTKQVFNGQDTLSFTDLLEIGTITQEISVSNENSSVSPSDRSSIRLSHFPVTNITRVFNVTTGERYIVTSQNPDGSGSINETGRIIVSGQTLPAVSDTLQIDYTWVLSYDPYWDFDNRTTNSNPRTVQDSIDWGFSNAVRRERIILTAYGSFLLATVTHPISSVISVNVFTSNNGLVTLSSGRLAFITSESISGVVSIVRDSDGAELWNTGRADGTFSGFTAIFPTDTDANFGDTVTVIFNAIDTFNATTQGNFNSNIITIVPSTDATAGRLVECNYIANIDTILPSTLLPSLPAIRSNNAFDTNTATGIGAQPTTHILSSGEIVQNLRQAPSNLGLTISGSISSGVITIGGTTIIGAFDIVFTAASSGLKHNLSSAIKSYLGLSTSATIPSNIRLARLVKMEKVTTTVNLDVLTVVNSFDIKGYHILDNSFVKEETVSDLTLSTTEITLPGTPDNLTNSIIVGDRIRVSFHLSTSSDTENINFSRAGTLYTNKKFALVDTVAISSGFTSGSSSSSTLTITNINQPTTRSRYKVFYDFTAPKVNERITARYNYDRLITDVTFNIENTRPINADVLGKASVSISVDVTMNVVVKSSHTNDTEIVRQNVRDVVTSALNATSLGTVVDYSDLITASYTVDGVDRVRVLYFNNTGTAGSVLSIQAEKNEFILANTVTIMIENR